MRQNATVPKWDKDAKMWTYRPSIDGVQKKYTSRKEGKAGAQECIRKHNAAIAGVDGSKTRLGDIWDKFLDDKKARLGADAESYQKAVSIGKNYILPRLGMKKVASISDQDWQDCINSARKKDGGVLAKKTLENIRGEITAFGRFARKKRIIDERITDLDIPKTATKIGKEILQPDELFLFLNDDSSWYSHLWQFMVVSGCRPGEAYGLKNEDVANGMIRIRRSICRQNRETPGKNTNAARTQMQTDMVAWVLKKQRDMLSNADIESDWVFPDQDGCRPVPSTISKYWIEYRKHYGHPIMQYGLRHTFVSLNKNHLPDALMKMVVGHAKSMDTLGVYGQKVDGDLKLAADIINGVFAKYSTNVVQMSKEKA